MKRAGTGRKLRPRSAVPGEETPKEGSEPQEANVRTHDYVSPLWDEIQERERRRNYESELVAVCEAIVEWYKITREPEMPGTLISSPKVAQA